MIDLDFIREAMPHPLIIIRFEQDQDLALTFCANTDEKSGDLIGLSLFAIRKSRGPHPYRLREDLVPRIFKPKLAKKKKPNQWKLEISPLDEHITLMKRSTHFVCLYPFRDHGKSGHIVDVTVRARRSPLAMWFTVNGTFKANKTAATENLTSRIECPEDFTKVLYEMFTGDA